MEENKDMLDKESEVLKQASENSKESSQHSQHHHSHSSYHRHHRHHHRHHHSHSDDAKNGKKFFLWIKKHRHAIVNGVACVIAVTCLGILAFNYDGKNFDNNGNVATESSNSTVKIEIPVYSEDIVLVSDAIVSYMDKNNTSSAFEMYRAYSGSETLLNVGYPLEFTYNVTELPINLSVVGAELELSEGDNVKTYGFSDGSNKIDIYNLKVDTKYDHRLYLTMSNGSKIEVAGSFNTAKTPRILNIDGTVNVRDIGGMSVNGGKKIKQGMVYRGSELDGAVEKKYCISQKGIDEMRTTLGIKFDMDLRLSTDNVAGINALGESVLHKYYGTVAYSEIFNDENKVNIRKVFSDLSDRNNYPVYIHCTYGRDRTGTICYLLEAILGASDGDMLKDYEISAFTDSYVDSESFENFTRQINMLEGNNTAEKVEVYLKSCGVTEQQIEAIREILLEN